VSITVDEPDGFDTKSRIMRRETATAAEAAAERSPQPGLPIHSDIEPDVAPSPIGRSLSSAQFWKLMESWSVPDATALDLIGYAGKIGASGKRPRFRFSPRQKRITSFLSEIDAALTASGEHPSWLHTANRAKPFGGKAPLAFMISTDMDGLADVLHSLTVKVLRAALKK
jgi:hypothetical protein